MSDKKHILIVDDDADLRELFSAKLEAAGFEVSLAENGQSGIDEAKKSKPDLILLDVQMPVMGGIEAISKMKEDEFFKGIKIAFLTNYGESDTDNAWLDHKFAKETGALDFIRKTENLDEVVTKVKQLLEV